ncbi:podocalyxin [Pteronotus mesoamericanus]|uniref:podocalyxin n=1 Tax=Pteronotus mesoamericanus TaxID=1884717 RepID=UPI0023EA9879|nr:podocalyxin [Pteronotus parnellii mesoamericanus]
MAQCTRSAARICSEVLQGAGSPPGELHLAGGRRASWALQTALQPGGSNGLIGHTELGARLAPDMGVGGSGRCHGLPGPPPPKARQATPVSPRQEPSGAETRSPHHRPSHTACNPPPPPLRRHMRAPATPPVPPTAQQPAPPATPARSRAVPPPAALQGGVSSSAHCSRPSARPALPCPAPRPPAGGGGGRRGQDGSLRSRPPSRSSADTARDATARDSGTAWLRAPASSAAAAARRGHQRATREHRVTARPPQPPPGLRERRPRSRRPGSRSLSQPLSHLLWARGQDKMRSALALSALLLLLPPLPSLSQSDVDPKTSVIPTSTSKPGSNAISRNPVTTSAPPAQQNPSTLAPSSGSSVTTPAPGVQKDVQGSNQNTPSTSAIVPTVLMKPGTTTSPEGNNTDPSGTQSNPSVTTNIMTTKGGSQTSPQTPPAITTVHMSPAVSSQNTIAGTQQVPLSPSAPNTPGSPPKGPSSVTASSRSPGMMTGHTTSQQTTDTLTTTPMVATGGKEHTCNEIPAVSGNSSSIPGASPSVTGASPSVTGASPLVPGTSRSDTPPPAVSSSGSTAVPPVRTTSSSTQLATTPFQGSNISFPTSALEKDRIKCEPPERLNEMMLILNVTKTNLCAESPPDDKLVTLLCRAAKANFNPSRDLCHIQLVPDLDTQKVAIKEITIQTKLLPKDLYESLRDKWDDLRELGVSNMQLGNQGPPEETEDRFSMPLIITIVCMASFLLLVAALYGCCHQRLSHRKDQQRLTEELQTVENGYHDNPTLEVMETSAEMQEKKVVNLNGELGDSWIVPLDNLMKDDLDEEEDTHL